jgi:hypothetical protein
VVVAAAAEVVAVAAEAAVEVEVEAAVVAVVRRAVDPSVRRIASACPVATCRSAPFRNGSQCHRGSRPYRGYNA